MIISTGVSLEYLQGLKDALSTATLQLVDQAQNLHRFNVALDPDPVLMGLVSLNSKIAQVQGNKDQLCQLMFQAITFKNNSENLVTEVEKFVALRKSESLESIPGLDAMKTQAMRDATIVKHLKDEYELLSQVTQLANDIKSLFQQINFQVSNLESANNNIKKQLEVVSFQLQIGEIAHKG